MSEPDYMMAQVMECCGLEPSETTHWTNGAGFAVPIREMSRPHLLNTLRWCERKRWPCHDGSPFLAIRREAQRRGFCPSVEEWQAARERATAIGVHAEAGYWHVWAGYGFFSRDGNPIRERENAEADYRQQYPDRAQTADEFWREHAPVDSDDM
jgi:hypothetical protein